MVNMIMDEIARKNTRKFPFLLMRLISVNFFLIFIKFCSHRGVPILCIGCAKFNGKIRIKRKVYNIPLHHKNKFL